MKYMVCFAVLVSLLFPATLSAQESVFERFNSPAVTIGTESGIQADYIAQKRMPKAKMRYFEDIGMAYTALLTGRIDAVVYDRPPLEYFERFHVQETTVLKESLGKGSLVVGAPFKRKELVARVNEFIRQYKADGTYHRMFERWIHESHPKMPDLPEPSKPEGTLHVGTSLTNEPMGFCGDNGEMYGFDIEFAKRLAFFLNMKVEFHPATWTSLILATQSGKYDLMIANLDGNERNRETMLLSDDYIDSEITLLVRADTRTKGQTSAPAEPQGEFKTLDELAGKRVACFSGSMFDKVLHQRIPDAISCFYPDLSSQIIATQTGKTDAFIIDSPVLRLILKRHPDLCGIDENVQNYQFGFILPKKQVELAREFSAFIDAARADGTLAKLEHKWSDGDESEKVMPAYRNDGGRGTIVYGFVAEQEPFCYRKEDETLGFEIELVRMFAEKGGYTLKLVVATFDSLIPSITTGKFDLGGGCITITEERAKSMLFTTPYHDGGACIVVRRKAAPQSAPGGSDATGPASFMARLLAGFHRTLVVESRWKMVLRGLYVTLILTCFSAIFGTLLAFPLCAARRSRSVPLSKLAALFIYLVRGTPIVVFLMVLYYVAFANVKISAMSVAVVGFSINFAAYFAEMLRSSIDAVSAGEKEAAVALGFSRFGAFWYVVLPQTIRYVMPMYKGEVVALLKATAIVGYIAVEDLTKASDIIRSRTYEAFFPLILVTIIYLVVAWGFIWLLSLIEFRIDPRLRSRKVKGVKTQC